MIRGWSASIMAAALLAGCSTSPQATPAATAETPIPTATPVPTETPDPTETPAPFATSPTASDWCEQAERVASPVVATTELSEASGLVANTAGDGLWSHNDSGDTASVFAVGLDGRDEGVWELQDTAAVDIEDIAVAQGERGTTLLLADIGDNAAQRASVVIHTFDEPDDWGSGGVIRAVDSFILRYPDGAHDAEAFFVDPLTGDWVIVTKATTGDIAQVFSTPAPIDPRVETVLVQSDPVDLNGLAPLDLGGLESAVTAADITPNGDLVALRTYLSIVLFPRESGSPIASAFDATPCLLPAPIETQGEAFAFVSLPQTRFGYATVSEGTNPRLNLFGVEVAD